MQNVIVCSGMNGRCVVFGQCEQNPVAGAPITLRNARMVLYWPVSCGGLFGLATAGPKEGLRLTHAVDITETDVVHQWLSVSESAAGQLKTWPPFEGA